MLPLASLAARSLGKRVGKVSTEAQEKSGFLNTYLIEIFKNHKLIKIFQRENYEGIRADKFVNDLKEKIKNCNYFCKNLSNYGNFYRNNDSHSNLLFWKIDY